MTDSQLVLTCLRCGAPAALGPYQTGEDHVPEDRSSKGMGGTSEPEVEMATLPFCRPCHRDRHLKEFRVERLGDGKVLITERNGKTATAAVPDPMTEEEVGEFALRYPYSPALTLWSVALRLPFCEDRVLADLWRAGMALSSQGKALEAMTARAFRVRYAQYGGEWYYKAAQYITAQTGERVSSATVYDRYALAIALDAADWDLNVLRLVGPAALSAAGKVEAVEDAVEKAQELREEGATARQTIRAVRGQFHDNPQKEPLNLQTDRKSCEEHVCRNCGRRWHEPAPHQERGMT